MGGKTKRMAVAGVIVLAAFMVFMSMGAGAADVSVSATVGPSLSLSVDPTVAFGAVNPGDTKTGCCGDCKQQQDMEPQGYQGR